MMHIELIIIASAFYLLSIASSVTSEFMRPGSSARFVCEKILSRSFAVAALVLMFVYGVKMVM